ncbi:MAG: hypothetical protein HKN19_01965 [Halioglobus sp.]|nr:hypothetical protein [Halioglobus sp.]
MLDKVLKGLAYLFSALLLVNGIQWLAAPATTAESFGMTLLDGIGRSTQIGDLSAFFIVAGGMGVAGLLRKDKSMLIAPAALVGCAAAFRTLAFAVHGAPFATQFIVVEIVMLAVFLAARSRVGNTA